MTIVLISSKTRPSAFREVYRRLLARGMRPAAALGHVAGKLSVVLYGMLKAGTPYDEAKHRRALRLAPANQDTGSPIEAPLDFADDIEGQFDLLDTMPLDDEPHPADGDGGT
jgi:hypothetical protein